MILANKQFKRENSMGFLDNVFKSRKEKNLERDLMKTDAGVKFYQGWADIGYALNNIVYRGAFGSYLCREVGRFDDNGYVYSGYHKIGRVERNNIYFNGDVVAKVKGKSCVSLTGEKVFDADKENPYAIGAALLLLFNIQAKGKDEEIEDYDELEEEDEHQEELFDEPQQITEEDDDNENQDEDDFQPKTLVEARRSKDWHRLVQCLITESYNLNKKQKIECLFAAFFVDVSGIDERSYVMPINNIDTGNYLMKPIKNIIKEYDLSDENIISIFTSSRLIMELSQEMQFYYFDINNCAKLLTIVSKEKGPIYDVVDKGIPYNTPNKNAKNYKYFDFN